MLKLKLDENFPESIGDFLRHAGHDVETVLSQTISGVSDRELFEICRKEKRCLITLDMDFADILRFPPQLSNGIVVFRPKYLSLAIIEKLSLEFINKVAEEEIRNKLWIVEFGKIRIMD